MGSEHFNQGFAGEGRRSTASPGVTLGKTFFSCASPRNPSDQVSWKSASRVGGFEVGEKTTEKKEENTHTLLPPFSLYIYIYRELEDRTLVPLRLSLSQLEMEKIGNPVCSVISEHQWLSAIQRFVWLLSTFVHSRRRFSPCPLQAPVAPNACSSSWATPPTTPIRSGS